IVLWWRPATTATASNHAMLVGATPGNGAVDPGSIDISASLPFTSTQPTVYERFLPTTFDLAARTIELLPNGTSGFVLLDRPSCLFTGGGIFPTGTGCPAGAELTQSFPGGNPTIGAVLPQQLDNVPVNANAAFLVLGFQQANVDLTPLGMP